MNVKANSNQLMLSVLTTRLERLQKDLTSKSDGKVNPKGFEKALNGAVNKAQENETRPDKVTTAKQQHPTNNRLEKVHSQQITLVKPVKDAPQPSKGQEPEDDQEYWMGQVMGLLQMLSSLAGSQSPEQVSESSDVTGDSSLVNMEELASMLQKLLETQLQVLGFKDAGLLSQQLLTLSGALSSDTVGQPAGNTVPRLDKITGEMAQQLIAQLDEALQKAGFAITVAGQTGGQAQTSLVDDPEQSIVQSLRKLVEKYSQAQGSGTLLADTDAPVDAVQQSPRFQQLVSELKPLLEQLAKGRITAENAAEQILAKPGLLDLIAQQVRSLQVKDKQASLTTATQVVTSQEAAETGLNMAPSPEAATASENGTAQKSESGLKNDLGQKNQPNLKNQPSQEMEKTPESKGAGIQTKGYTDQRTESLSGNRQSTNGLVSTEQLGEKPQFAPQLNPVTVTVGSDYTLANPTSLAEKPQQAAAYRQLATSLVLNQLVESSQVLVGRDHSQVKIQLKPDFLGKVALEVSVENGVVKAEIAAESQQVKQLIEANLGSLKQHLANQGLKVEQLIVSLGQGQTQSRSTREQTPQGGKGNRRNQQDTAIFEIFDSAAEYGGHLTEDQVVDYKI